ncbi:hypothetical protein K439DRAFT_1624089 [Ramaria rubella]|nr:hypothetical protein K439DRAFT_1624089 [Ramaria rubella]
MDFFVERVNCVLQLGWRCQSAATWTGQDRTSVKRALTVLLNKRNGLRLSDSHTLCLGIALLTHILACVRLLREAGLPADGAGVLCGKAAEGGAGIVELVGEGAGGGLRLHDEWNRTGTRGLCHRVQSAGDNLRQCRRRCCMLLIT